MSESRTATVSPPHTDGELGARLSSVRATVRRDLEVTRHVFRGNPSYVVHDPMSRQSYHLQALEYAMFICVDASLTLGEILETLVSRGVLAREDEKGYYEFILTLHRLNFLRLPISDDRLLYRRHIAKREAGKKEKLLTLLFYRLPLVNPNAFLDRTYSYIKPLFTWWFFCAWLILITAAIFVAVNNADRLADG